MNFTANDIGGELTQQPVLRFISERTYIIAPRVAPERQTGKEKLQQSQVKAFKSSMLHYSSTFRLITPEHSLTMVEFLVAQILREWAEGEEGG